MADLKLRHRPISKGAKLPVLIEEALSDVLIVCLEYGSKCFRGILLDTEKRNIPHGISLPRPLTDDERGPNSHATEVTVISGHLNKVKEKDNGRPTEHSSLPLRHTYNQDISTMGGKLTEMAKRSNTRHFKNKTVRNIRLRPRQTLCSKCRANCHDEDKNNKAVSQESTASNVEKPGQNSRNAQHSLRSKGRPMKPKPHRIELRKRQLIPVADTFPRVKLQRLDSSKFLCNDSPRDTAEASFSDTADADPLPEVDSNPMPPSGLPKVSPVIKISIGEGTVLKIPPRLHEIKESEGECEEEEPIPIDSAVEEQNVTRQDSDLNMEMPVLEIQRQPSLTREDIPLEKPSLDESEKLEYKRRKKAMKKAKSKEKYKNLDLGEHSENTHPERHHKHKKKHKHRHSHEFVERRPQPMVARSPLSSTSYSEGKQLQGACEDNISSRTFNTNNDFEKDSQSLHERPRLLYRWRPKDGLSSFEPKVKGGSVESHESNGDNVTMKFDSTKNGKLDNDYRDEEDDRVTWSAYSSFQSSPIEVLSTISSHSSSEEKEQVECMSDVNLNSSHSDVGEDGEDFSSNLAEDDRMYKQSEDLDSVENLKPSLMMRIQTRSVPKCVTSEGRLISVGDIIWGKIQGFPWWPGRVLSISVSQKDNGVVITQLAHVSWFGSSTMSHMQCSDLFPFLEDFKIRYNKKKRGPYKMAIKQATVASRNSMNIHKNIDFEEFDL